MNFLSQYFLRVRPFNAICFIVFFLLPGCIKVVDYQEHIKKISSKPATRLKNVIGQIPEDINILIDMIKNTDCYEGVCYPKGVLLFGPPGTGKTLLAKAIAGECDCPFFAMNGSQFNREIRGTGTRTLENLFKTAKELGAKQKPSIIFIDEFDAFARKRSSDFFFDGGDSNATINALLSLMDGFESNDNIVVIASTNKPELIDNAVLRAGRFDYHIEVPLPDASKRKKIWHCYLNKYLPSLVISEDCIEKLSELGNKMTGADIQSIVSKLNRSSKFKHHEPNEELLIAIYNSHVDSHQNGQKYYPSDGLSYLHKVLKLASPVS
jgi:ATP-dependent 26S proteasome regulatory subunit